MTSRRCCARCKTPYNCGNSSCACHVMNRPDAARAWNATNQEPTPAERHALAQIRDEG